MAASANATNGFAGFSPPVRFRSRSFRAITIIARRLLRAFPDCPTENGFVQYARDRRRLRVLCLDPSIRNGTAGRSAMLRAAWLERELNSHRDTPTILIFMHHPPVVAGIDWMDPSPEPWFRRFHETVAGHRQIVAIEAGHLHRPLHSSVEGIPMSVTPAVAPAVSLDLRPLDAEVADRRPIVAAEPPFYSLHLWRNGTILFRISSLLAIGKPWRGSKIILGR